MHDDDDDIEVSPFQKIAELIGKEKAAQLSARFGGRRLYIPVAPGQHHPLTVAIGVEAALLVADQFKNERLDIPVAEGKRLRIIEMRLVKKLPVAEIARELICTERHVYQVLHDARSEGDERQQTLFE